MTVATYFKDAASPFGVVQRPPGEGDRIVYPAGTRFTCLAGHHVATAAHPIHYLQRVDVALFADPPPFQARLVTMKPIGPCFCGRRWVGGEDGCRAEMHTAEGWPA